MLTSKRIEQRKLRPPQNLQSKAPVEPPASPTTPAPTPSKLSRISHACDRCRVMRTKCSGGIKCTKCIKDSTPCVYGDGKRERHKKDLAASNVRIDMLEDDVTELVAALRDLSANNRFHAEEFSDIVELLSKYPVQDVPDSSRASTELLSPSHSRGRGGGEEQVSAEVGSPGGQGALTNVVELGHGSGAAGFIGKMSEISWMQRAREHLLRDAHSVVETSQVELDQHDKDAKELNYFMDDVDLLSVDEDSVVMYEMPPLEISFILAEACFHALQGVFQFIHRDSFLRVLSTFPRDKGVFSWVERRWLGMANLVFAIGTKWLHQTGRQHENFNNHLEYYARARALGLDHRIVFDHPVLEQVQALGMLALYLFVNGSIARAWTILGHAIRHATALGLHLRVTDPTIGTEDRELRAHTWYSLYCLEILITETLGRPKSVALVDMTTPIASVERKYATMAYSDQILSQYGPENKSRQLWLDFLRNAPGLMGGITNSNADALSPVPLLDHPSIGQPPAPAHFPNRIRLCLMSHRIATALYSAGEDQTWSDVQRKIAVFEFELAQWLNALPPELSMTSTISTTTPSPNIPLSPFSPRSSSSAPSTPHDPRSKLELKLYYHSVQMILYRPCICPWTNKISRESHESKLFNIRCANAAVSSAISMLHLLPDYPSAETAYQLLPWWCLLHYVCQAAAVLVMELSLEAEHAPTQVHEIVESLKKAMTYLWCLTPGSLSAFRAYKIFRQLVADATAELVADGVVDLSDVPLEPVHPVNWSVRDEVALHEALVPAYTGRSPEMETRQTILGHVRQL